MPVYCGGMRTSSIQENMIVYTTSTKKLNIMVSRMISVLEAPAGRRRRNEQHPYEEKEAHHEDLGGGSYLV